MITQRDFMKQDILLEQKIGLRLSRIGLLSKIFAGQQFVKNCFDITPEQFTVLYTLKINNGMYLRQLACVTLKDRHNITRIVSILEAKEYLTSAIDKEKRMVKKLYITEKGLDVCEKVLPSILNIWQDTVANISEEEIEKFLKTLNKIEVNLKDKVVIQN